MASSDRRPVMLALHVVAHAISGMLALDAEAADWLWLKLREAFPVVFAACLMPEHVHMLIPPESAPNLAARLGRVLGGFSRHVGLSRYWAPVTDPTVVPNLLHLRRTVRYIHMNPCRDDLVEDPLCWPWSTHRDVVGARYAPWLEATALAASLGFRQTGFPEYFHRYAAKDRDLESADMAFPRPHSSIGRPLLAHGDLVAGVLASGMYLGAEAKVRLLSHAARREGWPVARFAGSLGKSERTMQRYAREDVPRPSNGVRGGPDACAMCLGDRRLRCVPSFPDLRAGVVRSRVRAHRVRSLG